MGSIRGGSICRLIKISLERELQLESGSQGSCDGCIPTGVEREEGLCLYTFRDDSECTAEIEAGEESDSSGDTVLGVSGLVTISNGASLCRAIVDACQSGPTQKCRGGRASFGFERGFEPSCLESVRRSFGIEGLLERAAELLEESWAPGTRNRYKGIWRIWSSWCVARSLDPVEAPVVEVVNFLTEKFHKGLEY